LETTLKDIKIPTQDNMIVLSNMYLSPYLLI